MALPESGIGKENPTNGLLRAIRKALRVPVAEIAEKAEVGRSTLFDFERRELESSITLKSLSRIAEAMDCKLVYGIVPNGGKTLEALAEERMWRAVLGEDRDQGSAVRDQGQVVSNGARLSNAHPTA